VLENYNLPGDLEQQIVAFIDYCNNQYYHESLNNVTLADVYFWRDYFGRYKDILTERKRINSNESSNAAC